MKDLFFCENSLRIYIMHQTKNQIIVLKTLGIEKLKNNNHPNES